MEVSKSNSLNLGIKKDKTSLALMLLVLSLSVVGLVFIFSLLSPSQVSNNESQYAMQLFQNDLQSESMREFMNFLGQYERVYIQEMEQIYQRYQIFKENFEKISFHNKYHLQESMMELGVNQFTDLSEEEFINSYTGLKIPFERQERMKNALSLDQKLKERGNKKLLESSALPSYVNWNAKGMVSIPENQQECGSCWAFTTASTLETLAMIEGHDKVLQEYSIQQLMDCDDYNQGCDGGWMYKGFNYTRVHGIMLKKDYPSQYVAKKNSKCYYDKSKVHFKNIGMIEHDSITNEEMKEILTKQPIGSAINANGMLQYYKSGVATEKYLRCSNTKKEVNHGITIVGYGRVNKTTDIVKGMGCEEYWIVRNSWGPDWGEKGFFRLCMDEAGSGSTLLGTCLINKYTTWPTMVKGTVISNDTIKENTTESLMNYQYLD